MTTARNSRNGDILSKIGSVLGGYQSGYELVEGWKPDAIEKFTVICSRGTPRLLLPPSRLLMGTAMTRFLGGRNVMDLVPSCAQMAARIGGPFKRFSINMSLTSQSGEPSPLRELISEVVGRDDFQIALRSSFGRPNAKTVAMAISDSGEVLCFVKLGSEAMTNALVAHESAILEQYEADDMPVVMPKRLYFGAWADGQNVLVTAPLQLEPLERDADIAHKAADALVSQTKVASSLLVDSAYWQRIVENTGSQGKSGQLSETVAKIEQKWGNCEFDFGASHGDWTRANLGLLNGRIAALDWERCNQFAPRGIDIAHFALFEKSISPFKKALVPFSKALDIDEVVERLRVYLKSAGLPPERAEILTSFALLEMIVRFKFAESAGLQSIDKRFTPALQEGLRKWAW